MADIACPVCSQRDDLQGTRRGEMIELTCGQCGHRWERDPAPTCSQCDGRDLRPVVAAIIEKGRGTQLSVVGTRTVYLCERCDAAKIERYERNRPNPLMPDQLPTIAPEPSGGE